MDILSKTKDHPEGCFNLVDLGIRMHLQSPVPTPSLEDNQTIALLLAKYTIRNEAEGILFIKETKLPHECNLYIRCCVQANR